MIKSIGKGTYQMNVSDVSWVYQNIELQPQRFAKEFLSRRFVDSEKKFPDVQAISQGCCDIIKANKSYFDSNPTDQRMRDNFFSLLTEDTRQIIASFRDLMRGYTDAEVVAAQRSL